ncbi:glycoside hydrolase family 16 protein [Roseateles cellulosilyticus]|uniref:Glycoside hydrolase family 16 protein n=1 Tax=Pelomonas cellulosilytica TaxID=2906762 RepID=A0ABS8Y4C2_9BURK|nr:glycoside hydrolase family 16 protein [Pelomonas sp. P8]MCE4556995.1 glycoside hydrolase family 16 protein [Pelomonas sp. P8]
MNDTPRRAARWRHLLPALAALLTAWGSAAAPASDRWTLVWSDEFDGVVGSRPNAASWSHDLGNAATNGWGNHELEFYTADARNAQLDGQGMLVITAERAANAGPCWNGTPCPYTSARIHTHGKVSFTYGKVEARMKLPAGAGIWPAFWMLGTDLDEAGWPASGELDIMEFIGKTPDTIYGTAHGPGYSGAGGLSKPHPLKAPVADAFHTYTLIKRPHEVIWQVDGVEYHRITTASLPAGTKWVFEKPMHLLLNLAVGGDWPGPPDAGTVFPARMQVDWVRIYKEN